ncbi:hypothetical protein B0H16DRAFT_1833181 [Mycena metata]|uniref:DUF6729 domain-containing protein n=1 Tax=Mycena metata TaxID=1033252 RepID=A0AAD7J1Q7_9AGAR|nr:hypothetical protein B0H16DRAFT_1833181 [Mycena metata]
MNPSSPDYFAEVEDFDDAILLDMSPLKLTGPVSAPVSPSPGPRNMLPPDVITEPSAGENGENNQDLPGNEDIGAQGFIPSRSNQFVPYIHTATSIHQFVHDSNQSQSNSASVIFVDDNTEIQAARGGRPPNPETVRRNATEKRSVGRPRDSTKFQAYAGPQTFWTGPSGSNVTLKTDRGGPMRQRTLAEWGPAQAPLQIPDSVPTIEVPILNLSTPPRVEYIIPDADPNRTIDVDDDIDLSDPSERMGEGQGQEDLDPEEDDDGLPRKRAPLPHFVKTAYEKFKTKLGDKLYEMKTFWVPQQAGFFILRSKQPPAAEDMYNARLYFWAPDLLVDDPLCCPSCGAKLIGHGYTRPRRVVDLNNCFYMIGRRYLCPKCKNPKSDKPTVTFNSWDARIMKSLPIQLQDEFPAYLSHRGAMSKTVFELMRTFFQYGLGSKQFSNSLQVLHRLHFDRLHAQYLDGVIAWAKAHPEKASPTFTEFSSFDDPQGYAGFVPSSAWLCMMYNQYIEEHGAAMDQQTNMKSMRLGQLDHGYKVPKQIMKINGESVFAATLTVTNEWGEARILVFVATSSHSEYESALLDTKKSLELYGHSQPEVIFTDNPAADKPFLENIFPSLTKDVVPVVKDSGMELFIMPNDISVRVSYDLAAIENEIAKITHDINIQDATDKLVVGFDAEWNVDTASGTTHPTAIIQIAYKTWVNVFQIAHFKGKLPAALIAFLSNGQIIKVGRAVKVDLDRLAKESNAPQPFYWNQRNLSAEQTEYAALDALVSLQIYDQLVKKQAPGRIDETALPGTPVSVHNTDGQIIANGLISADTAPILGAPPVTKTRIRIQVTETLIPGALVSLHGRKALQTFGPVPFDIVFPRNRVFTQIIESSANPSVAIEPVPTPPAADDAQLLELVNFLQQGSDEVVGMANTWMDEIDAPDPEINPAPPSNGPDNVDQAALAAALNLLNDPEFSTWSLEIRSRVIMDVWHAMARVKVSKEHGMRYAFGIALRDAIFIPNPEDKALIEAYLKTQKSSWEEQLRFNALWLWRRCRRVVPPPAELYHAVSQVYMLYGPQKDTKTKMPLFNAQAWHDAKNVLKAIKLGLLSDPPGVQVYFQMGVDRKNNANLPVYRCARGTTTVEGGIHHSLRTRMPKSGTSIRHAAARIKDYVFIHNLVVGTLNRTGHMYRGHYNVEVLNRLQVSLELARHLIPNAPILRGWINGDLYIQGEERIGILPLPEVTRNAAGILRHVELTDSKFKHAYLAKQQGTKYAVITVHSVEEKLHFTKMMQNFVPFNIPNKPPDWTQGALQWNKDADGETIFYKVEEHLRSYHLRWLRAANQKSSISQVLPQIQVLQDNLRSNSRISGALSVPAIQLSPNPLTLTGLRTSASLSSTVQNESPTFAETSTLTHSTEFTTPDLVASSAGAGSLGKRGPTHDSFLWERPKHRQRRTCNKCRQDGCKGGSKKSLCPNPCGDCNSMVCEGRSATFPDVKCGGMWVD